MKQSINNRHDLPWIAILLPVWLMCIACADVEGGDPMELKKTSHAISTQGVNAAGPFFTIDHQGFPILVWSEKLKGGDAGLHQTRVDKKNQSYSKKELLTRNGSHPQTLTTSDGKIVYFWEEDQNVGGHSSGMSHNDPIVSINLNSFSPSQSVIKAQVWENNVPIREHWVSMPDQFARLPVGIPLLNGYIGIAWIQQNEDGSDSVVYRQIKG